MEEKRIEREKETEGIVFPFLIPKIRVIWIETRNHNGRYSYI